MSAVGALIRVQEESFARAGAALRGSWPPERAMDEGELDAFLTERTFCVLATTAASGHPQARPVGFAVFADALWFSTVAGGRLRNLERTPWASVVISEGEGEEHRVVVAEGPVAIRHIPPEGLLDLWQGRFGSRAAWAAAWIELRPERLYSHTHARG